jgi:DNA-binding MarR family transcriptional regulator
MMKRQAATEPRPRFTLKQGQYLAFIHAYRRLLGRSPAEADMHVFFRVTPPAVHQMVLSLEKAGLITRTPGKARSIELALDPADLPELISPYDQPPTTTVRNS